MDKGTFSLQIGNILFNAISIAYIAFGLFVMGILVGVGSIIYIENPETPLTVTIPLLGASAASIAIIIKGIKKVEIKE